MPLDDTSSKPKRRGRPPKNDPLALSQLTSKLRRSLRWRKEEGYDDLWDRMVDLYEGRHYETPDNDHDRLVINMAFATKNVIAPSIAINNPRFAVNARLDEHVAQAVMTEQVLNYLWRTHKYQRQFRLGVDDALSIGHGWLKVGWKATKPKAIVAVPDKVEGTEDPDGVDDREDVPHNSESELQLHEDDDRPYVERISWKDVAVDPDATSPELMTWIAQRTKRPLVDVVVDERYDKKARESVRSRVTENEFENRHRSIDSDSGDQERDRSNVQYVEVWEFYDIRKGEVSTFAWGSEEGFLIPPKPIPYTFGHPFVMVPNYEVPDRFYPIGELEQIEVLQHELNETRTQMLNHRKRYQRKVLYDKDAFDDDGVEALADDADNVMVPVDLAAAQENIQNVVAPMPQMGTPPDFYNQTEMIQADIDRVSGVSEYMRASAPNIRRTATEAAMIQDAQNARSADKLSRIEGVLAEVGQRIIELMQQFMTGEQVMRIGGRGAQQVFVRYDADYIQGRFDFEVEGGSTTPRNESFRRQTALQFMDAMAPLVQAGVVNPVEVARHVLQFGFDVKDPDRYLAQQGPALPQDAQGMGQPYQPGGGDAPPEETVEGLPPQLTGQLEGQFGFSPSG